MVEGLASKVSSLKHLTINIGDEVREQNRLLNEMVRLRSGTLNLLKHFVAKC